MTWTLRVGWVVRGRAELGDDDREGVEPVIKRAEIGESTDRRGQGAGVDRPGDRG